MSKQNIKAKEVSRNAGLWNQKCELQMTEENLIFCACMNRTYHKIL